MSIKKDFRTIVQYIEYWGEGRADRRPAEEALKRLEDYINKIETKNK